MKCGKFALVYLSGHVVANASVGHLSGMADSVARHLEYPTLRIMVTPVLFVNVD